MFPPKKKTNRISNRFPATQEQRKAGFELNGDFVPAELVNYSRSGAMLRTFANPDLVTGKELGVATCIGRFSAEICWVSECPEDSRVFEMGLRITSHIEELQVEVSKIHGGRVPKQPTVNGSFGTIAVFAFLLLWAVVGGWFLFTME